MKMRLRSLGPLVGLLAALLMGWAAPATAQPSDEPIDYGDIPDDATFVQTIPPLQGVGFRIGGLDAKTNAQGLARIFNVPRFNRATEVDHALEVTSGTFEINSTTRARFSRFYNTQAGARYTRAVFNVDHLVAFRFEGIDGYQIPDEEIDEVKLRSSIGDVLTLVPSQTKQLWLHGSRVVPLSGTLESKPVYWTVDDVVVKGASVVNRAQHRFLPQETQAYQVNLLFFEAQLQVRDAFFRFSTGDAVLLKTPSGDVERHELSDEGTLRLQSLPRGDYHITVLGPGLQIERPLAISRNQVAELKLYTWLDCFVALSVVLGFVVGLAWVGLRRRRNYRPVPQQLAQPPPARVRRQAIPRPPEGSSVGEDGSLDEQPTPSPSPR